MIPSPGKLKNSKISSNARSKKTGVVARKKTPSRIAPISTRPKMAASLGVLENQPESSNTVGSVSSHWATGRDVVLALFMTIGISAVFIFPGRAAHFNVTTPKVAVTREQVLGESIALPLTIPVIMYIGGERSLISTSPKNGTLIEAVSQAAAERGGSLTYVSRGESIYLRSFLNISNDETGSWEIRVNGLVAADISVQTLEQGDEVTITRLTI